MESFPRPKRVKVASPVFKETEGEPKRYYTEPTERAPATTEQDLETRESWNKGYEQLSKLIPGWTKSADKQVQRAKVRTMDSGSVVNKQEVIETPEEVEKRKENAIRLLQDSANTNIDIDELLDSGEIKENEIEEIIQRLKQ